MAMLACPRSCENRAKGQAVILALLRGYYEIRIINQANVALNLLVSLFGCLVARGGRQRGKRPKVKYERLIYAIKNYLYIDANTKIIISWA